VGLRGFGDSDMPQKREKRESKRKRERERKKERAIES